MAVKSKPITLESLTKAELVALARHLMASELDLWWARLEVVRDEVDALNKAHTEAGQRVAPFRVAFHAATTNKENIKARRELKAVEAEEQELWRRLRTAWDRRDKVRQRIDAMMEADRRQRANSDGGADADG